MTKASKSRIAAVPVKSGKAPTKGKSSKEDAPAFFQDSDDAEMEWSSASGDEDFDEDEEFMDEDSDDLVSSDGEAEDDEGEGEEDEDEDEEEEEDDEYEVDGEDEEQEALPESSSTSANAEDDDRDIEIPSKFGQEQLASSPFLRHFWRLSTADRSERLEAVVGIMEHLLASQAVYVTPEGFTTDGKSERILFLYDGGRLADKCCPDLTYTIKRLIKGLLSGRNEARSGFTLGLLAVFDTFRGILDASVLLDWIVQLTAADALGGSVKKRELKDLYFGRIFSLSALFKSGLGKSLDEASKLTVVDMLVSMSKKSSLVRETCTEVLRSVAESVESESHPTFLNEASKKLAAVPALSTESLVFALMCQALWDHQLALDCLPESLKEFPKPSALLSPANVSVLAPMLSIILLQKDRLHCIWPLVLAVIGEEGSMSIEAFMCDIVDPYFINGTSALRREAGLLLVAELCKKVMSTAGGSLQPIFTPSVIRMIKSALGLLGAHGTSSPNNEVAKANAKTVEFFRSLVHSCASSSERFAADVIIALSHSVDMEQKKTLLRALVDEATASSLFSRLSSEGLIRLIDSVISDMQGAYDASKSPVAFQMPLDKLIAFVKKDELTKLPDSSLWIRHLISKLVSLLHSWEFAPFKAVTTARLQALVFELLNQKRFPQSSWLEVTAAEITQALPESLDEPTLDAMKNIKKLRSLLEKGKVGSKPVAITAQRLADFFGVMVFLEPLEFVPMSSELLAIVKDGAKSDADLSEIVSGITELLLSMLSMPSQLCRKITEESFVELIPVMTAESMAPLIKLLEKGSEESLEEIDDDFTGLAESEQSDSSESESDDTLSFGMTVDSAELSDLDDEEMAAYDAKLADIFRAKRKALPLQTRQNAMQLKFKVLDVVSSGLRSPLLSNQARLEAMPSLLAIIKGYQTANKSDLKSFFTKLEALFVEVYRKTPKSGTVSSAEAKAAETMALEFMDAIIKTRQHDHAGCLHRLSTAVHFCVKLSRCDASFSDAALRTKFSELLRFALSPEERRFKLIKAFVFNWINWEPSYFVAIGEHSSALETLLQVKQGGLRPFQMLQLNEFVLALAKRLDTSSVDQLLRPAAKAFSLSFAAGVPNVMRDAKIETFRDLLKFFSACFKKHVEVNEAGARSAWESFISTGLPAVEAHWSEKLEKALQSNNKNQISSIKSLLGQLKVTYTQVGKN